MSMSENTNNKYYDDFTRTIEEAKKTAPWIKDDMEFNELWVEALGSIVKRRKQLGLSQRDIAQMIDKPQSTIARIEACKTIPNTQTLFKLVNALGLSIIIK